MKFNFLYMMVGLFALVLIQNWISQSYVRQISYSDFNKFLRNGQVENVVIFDSSIKGTLKSDDSGKGRHFATNRVPLDLANQLEKYNVNYSQTVDNGILQEILSWIIPPLIFVLIWLFVMKKMSDKGVGGGGFMSIGKSKAKVYVEKDTKITFTDVAGVDEAKAELQEVVDFLKDAARYGRLGGRMPKGVLLVGPPGTGKTLLAKAVAGQAKVPFFSISGSEFVEMFVGVGAARVRDLFEQARKSSPCIIFVDELDALGKARSATSGLGGHDEKEQTLNQLLTEMDGFESKTGIVLIGATNRPEILDPALLRSGRFDRQVLVDRPDKLGRIAILKVHLKKVIYKATLETVKVAELTTGFTGADLANLVNEAALAATRRDAQEIEMNDFTVAIERIIAGLEKRSRILNPQERKITAFHEMGHALVAYGVNSQGVVVHKVSIIPRGIGALGYTIQRPTEDRFLQSKLELEQKMAVLLGGRAAEMLEFSHLSTGAADDLAKATNIAKDMITRYGMNETLGHVSYQKQSPNLLGQSAGEFNVADTTAREIDEAVKQLLEKAYMQALNLLRLNHDVLRTASEQLLQQETLSEEDLQPIFSTLRSV